MWPQSVLLGATLQVVHARMASAPATLAGEVRNAESESVHINAGGTVLA